MAKKWYVVGGTTAQRRAFRLGLVSIMDLSGHTSYRELQTQIRATPRPYRGQPAAAVAKTMRTTLREHKRAVSA
jgi:hypothetical protein